MSVEGLTRENVASHLQKYRLYLKRVQVRGCVRVRGSASVGASVLVLEGASKPSLVYVRCLPGR